MHSTSVYSLKRSVFEGAGAKALATDHRGKINLHALYSQLTLRRTPSGLAPGVRFKGVYLKES